MISIKAAEKTIPEIEKKLPLVGGDMIKIEYLENCLKQILPNDVLRFCHLKAAELYASRLMFKPASKHMDVAAECATTYKDKVTYYLKEIEYLLKDEDYLFIDKAFKKALDSVTPKERVVLQDNLKKMFVSRANDYEKKGRNNAAIGIYEKLKELRYTSSADQFEIGKKLADLYSKTGKIREAMRMEGLLKNPANFQKKRDPEEEEVKRVSFEDLGIDSL